MTKLMEKPDSYDAILASLEEPIDGDAILRNVRAVLPIVREEAEASAKQGFITDRLNGAFKATGAYRAGFSKDNGGPEMSLEQQTEMVEIVGQVDAGCAWNVCILAATGFYAGRLGKEAYDELYPNFDFPTAGSFHPRGRADIVDGGFNVTGHWSFGSGIHAAHYVLGGCELFENGEPVLRPDGVQVVIGVWFRTDEVEIQDDWHVVGLSASGSSGYKVKDKFIPTSHSFDRYFEPNPNSEPLNKLVDLPFYSMIGITLGLGQQAVDLATEALRKRPKVNERQLSLLGEAQSLLRAARAVSYAGVKAIDDKIFTEGALPTPFEMAPGDAPVAADLTRKIVDNCAELVGSRLVYESYPMEKIVRDFAAVTAHASVWRSRYIEVGRLYMTGEE